MDKFTQGLMVIVAFALGMMLGHVQAGEWDKQRAEKARIECVE